MSDSPPKLSQELLDDFFTECAEHFEGLRRHLSLLADDASLSDALEAVYRHLHSLKGNAGIVGLPAMERLAHSAEDVLRAAARGERPLRAAGVDLIGRAVGQLEAMVVAFRTHEPAPSADELVAQLAAGASAPGPANATTLWRARFAPSAALDARGVNVNAVRTRLLALGPVVRAEPSIVAGGIQFDFWLPLSSPPPDEAGWASDGLIWMPAPEATAPVPAAVRAPVSAAQPSAAPSHIVRVDLVRLDEVMRLVGEMVIQRSRLAERVAQTGDASEALQEPVAQLGRLLRDMRMAVTRMRLVPVAEAFGRLPFVVRDLERDSGKQVKLSVEGENTEIDKFLVERLKEPLLHLVRNAVSHGIESPGDRRAAGKPETGTLKVRASMRGEHAVIELADDGRGVDVETVRHRAAEIGAPVSAEPDAAELLAILSLPGFSTRPAADRAAGRGIGMDVVATTVRELAGSLAMETAAGAGTRFILRVPLTLSVVDAFIISGGGQTCAVPQSFVEEIVLVETSQITSVQGAEVAPYRGGLLPLLPLHGLFRAPPSSGPSLPVVVIATERGMAGLLVDRVHGHREVVVRPLTDPLVRVPGIAGATELGDGKPVLILDPPALLTGPVRPLAQRSAA